jgi:hypothetical protein
MPAESYSFAALGFEIYSRGLLPFYALSDDALLTTLLFQTADLSVPLFGNLFLTLPGFVCVH